MNNKQPVSRKEYRRLDNRVTCILQQRWPANEISQWVRMLKGKQQAVACADAILASSSWPCRNHPIRYRPHFRSKSNSSTVLVRSSDDRPIGGRYIVEGLIQVAID